MELRQLKYFVAVAEELHFRRAAERCFVAQPAVSEQVRKLEQEVGAKLLDRTNHSVSLTEAGKAMLPEARQVLDGAETARAAAATARKQATTRLRVGYAPAALLSSVAHALQRVAGSAPRVHTTLEAGSPIRLIADVDEDRLDAAVIPLPSAVGDLRVTRLADQRIVAVLRAGHAHAVRAAIDLRQVSPEQLLVMPRETNRPLYDAIVAVCRSAGVAPALVELPADDFEHALLAVASSRDIALLQKRLASVTPRRASGSCPSKAHNLRSPPP